VDDGTGVIGCCVWLNTNEFDERVFEYKHGDLVSVSGKLTIFREEREIVVDRIGG
jgi:OB-fold nucleic acid binding domain.